MLRVKIDKSGFGSIKLDDQEINNKITGITISARVGQPTKAEINMIDEIEYEGPVEVYLVDPNGRKISLYSYLKK